MGCQSKICVKSRMMNLGLGPRFIPSGTLHPGIACWYVVVWCLMAYHVL